MESPRSWECSDQVRSVPFLTRTPSNVRTPLSANERDMGNKETGVVIIDSATEGSATPHKGSAGDATEAGRPSRMRIRWNCRNTESPHSTPREEEGAGVGQLLSMAAEPLKVEKNRAGVRIDPNVHSRVLKVLKQFDVDGDDTLDVTEVTALVEHLLAEEKRSRNMKWAVIGLIAFTIVLLAAMTGVTYAIVAMLKDTKVENDIYLVTKSGNIIQTANTDLQVSNGLLMDRLSTGLDSAADGSSNVLRVSTYSGIAQGINSLMDIGDLMELNYLHINSPDGEGELALRVNGVARKKMPQSLYGTVVDILTSAGTIVLDGEDIFFEASMSSVFEEAGFQVGNTATTNPGASTGRRLLNDNTAVTGRYARLVSVLPPPPVNNLDIAHAWLIEASSKEEAQDATMLLAALKVENADESEYATMWHDYKRVYNKVYASMKDDLAAFRTWIKNMLRVLNVNSDDTLPYWTSPNAFSDVEFEVLKKTLLMQTPPPNTTDIVLKYGQRRRSLLADDVEDVPLADVIDWTAEGKVTAVRDQGLCGSCWAYAAAAALESALLITYPHLDVDRLDISEQHYINCVNQDSSPYFMSVGCLGGDPYEALSYTWMFNVTSEQMMPDLSSKTGKEFSCDLFTLRSTKKGEVSKSSDDTMYVYPFNDEQELMRAVMKQPIAAYFMVDETFMGYKGGVYTPTTCTTATNHNFLIVGYNKSAPIPYWLIKNQWGEMWGENGYAKIEMTGDEWGPCGMYSFATYPVLEFDLHPPFTLSPHTSVSESTADGDVNGYESTKDVDGDGGDEGGIDASGGGEGERDVHVVDVDGDADVGDDDGGDDSAVDVPDEGGGVHKDEEPPYAEFEISDSETESAKKKRGKKKKNKTGE